jgi:hypothetical protein
MRTIAITITSTLTASEPGLVGGPEEQSHG